MTSEPEDDSPYHAGERAVQGRAGVRELSERLGRKMIRSAMPEQHRVFFAELPYVLVGSVDEQGQPWASMLAGPPGFVSSPEPNVLEVRSAPSPVDPLSRALRPGAALGVLGIQLETRRRNRVNGRVTAVSEHGFRLSVDQSFGNCPKYITRRAVIERTAEPLVPPSAASEGAHLSEAARALIAHADTCFVASCSGTLSAPEDPREGVDVSHRGGAPGFIELRETPEASELVVPDYVGNNSFNTLGNLARYPKAGLLFPDFSNGDLLLVTCDAEIVWGGEQTAQFEGAQRLLQLRVRAGLRLPGAMPFRWSAPLEAARA